MLINSARPVLAKTAVLRMNHAVAAAVPDPDRSIKYSKVGAVNVLKATNHRKIDRESGGLLRDAVTHLWPSGRGNPSAGLFLFSGMPSVAILNAPTGNGLCRVFWREVWIISTTAHLKSAHRGFADRC